MIGERLAELRIQHNMTQEEFAERLDVSRQAVSKWELDKTLPDVNNLLKISELYQVNVDYLLKGTIEKTLEQPLEEFISEENNNEHISAPLHQGSETEHETETENAINEENIHTKDQAEQKSDIKDKHIRVGLCISLAFVSILLLGSLVLLAGCLTYQVWDKSDSKRSLVKVEKVLTQYSLAEVSSYNEDGTSVTKTILLDTNGVRNGDYIYCYTNAKDGKIYVNYTVSTIIIILSVSLMLLCIWTLLAREVRRK